MKQESQSGRDQEEAIFKLDNVQKDQTIVKRQMHESIVSPVYISGKRIEKEGKDEGSPKKKNKQRNLQEQKKNHEKRHKDRVTITTYNPSDENWWKRFFSSCCCPAAPQPQYQDCQQCGRRVYECESDSSEDQPYVSQQRMRHREKQSINVFYDRIKNNELMKTSWE